MQTLRNSFVLNINILYCRNKSATVLWDSGSDRHLITHSKVKKLRLKGRNIYLSVMKAGDVIQH